MLSPAPTAQEFFWDDLLEYIGEKRVIPIVGAELLTVPDGAGGEVPLMRVLAQRLAERLRVAADDCTGDDALHQVVCRHLQRGGRREEVYPRIRTLFKELAPAVPPILRDLARIRHFNVFVTTTFDSLLAQALDEERHAGARTPSRSPTRRTTTPTCPPTPAAATPRRCFICSAGSPLRPTTSSPRRTRWSSSPRCSRSRNGRTFSSTS